MAEWRYAETSQGSDVRPRLAREEPISRKQELESQLGHICCWALPPLCSLTWVSASLWGLWGVPHDRRVRGRCSPGQQTSPYEPPHSLSLPSSKTNALNVSQKMIEMFVRTKHKIDKSHEFALVVVNDDTAWVRLRWGQSSLGSLEVGRAPY